MLHKGLGLYQLGLGLPLTKGWVFGQASCWTPRPHLYIPLSWSQSGQWVNPSGRALADPAERPRGRNWAVEANRLLYFGSAQLLWKGRRDRFSWCRLTWCQSR